MATTTMETAGADGGRYARIQRQLHWIIAVLVLGNLIGGAMLWYWGFEGLSAGLGQTATNLMYNLHKSAGVILIGLMAARVWARQKYHHPPMPSSLTRTQSQMAYSTHIMFYVLLVAMPILGWLGSDLGGFPVELFFLDLSFLPDNKGLGEAAFVAHGIVGLAIAVLAVIHIAAALDHRRRGDGVFQRISLR